MLLLSLVNAQLNLQDTNSIAQYAKRMAAQAINYYKVSPGSDGQGAVMPKVAEDASGIQWFESGIYWGALMEYTRMFNDTSFSGDISSALALASFNETGSFLGALSEVAATLQGKWNDDILWWGLATMTGAEIFGRDAVMPGGKTFLAVSEQTYNEAWQQWDNQCGGGIYWSRDRNNARNRGYKSTITNVQHMLLGARLFLLTRNQTYLDNAKRVNDWLMQRIVVNGAVYDGLDVLANCNVQTREFTYNSGLLMGAQGWLFRATNDNMWISQSSSVLARSMQIFTNNGVLIDLCEATGCKPNEVPFKGPFSQGVGYLAAFTNNNNDKNTILTLFRSSMEGMLRTCDANANCNQVWTQGARQGSNFHSQTAALQLINAYTTALTGTVNQVTLPPPAGNGNRNAASSITLPILAFGLVMLVS